MTGHLRANDGTTSWLARRHEFADTIPNEIIDRWFDFGEDTPGTLLKVGFWEGGYTVWAFDGVINEWTEWFDTLSSALARVAAVVYCGEHGWDVSFADDASQFRTVAQTWFGEVTR
jgi:hypothetical protein